MPRVKRGTKRRARRKKYLKRTKGFFLTKSKLYQSAQEAANRADRYAKRDRRVKKRQYRRLWIQRVGAAARQNGMTYGQLIHGLKAAGIAVDRKVLADIAVKECLGSRSWRKRPRPSRPNPPQKRPRTRSVIPSGVRRVRNLSFLPRGSSYSRRRILLRRGACNRAPALYSSRSHVDTGFETHSDPRCSRHLLRRTGPFSIRRLARSTLTPIRSQPPMITPGKLCAMPGWAANPASSLWSPTIG